ncbi:hypothetical protein [Desulfosporosinus shakirovi]|uniref:hypothetical protein n=1 Tax=Desulfosporosinus shakirovi TaxID=2885154 RepID=UPI001E602688|nr:hypothetical protein [Desulfosporosinus sp. SRJS8]MCB8818624.1 hypothetical protein [Desulfosporosinus sp. SRJS8]
MEAFSKEVLAELKNRVSETSGEILMVLKHYYPTPFLKSTLITKAGLKPYVGNIAIERLEAVGLIDCDNATNGFNMYHLASNGIKMLELIEGNQI